MNKCEYFCPNEQTHPEFAQILREAVLKGVKVIALTCRVTPDTLSTRELNRAWF